MQQTPCRRRAINALRQQQQETQNNQTIVIGVCSTRDVNQDVERVRKRNPRKSNKSL